MRKQRFTARPECHVGVEELLALAQREVDPRDPSALMALAAPLPSTVSMSRYSDSVATSLA